MKLTQVFAWSVLLLGMTASGQRGLPSKEATSAAVHTSYPSHLDFKPELFGNLKADAGYTIKIVAKNLGKPRMMTVGLNNSLYVTRRDQGDVLMLTNPGADGAYTFMKTIISQFKGVHGICIHSGYLYLCSNTELKRARLDENGLPGELQTLIKDLPDGGQHGNRTISFGPDNNLYISVGSDCNDCGETNALHATMLKVDSVGGQRKIFARGLRNTIGFDWNPQTKEMWGMDNGTDWRGDSIPPEELNQIKDGADYGWPLVYGKQHPDQTREDPLGSTKEVYAATTEPSIMDFPAHSAPINFLFLSADDAIVSWHGSWNRQNPEGYKVQKIHFENGIPVRADDFFSGFLMENGKTRFGRPAGLAKSADGVIYISDDESGLIYSLVPKK